MAIARVHKSLTTRAHRLKFGLRSGSQVRVVGLRCRFSVGFKSQVWSLVSGSVSGSILLSF